eukprot:14744055-Heterocapsa_arctica.AAC.1
MSLPHFTAPGLLMFDMIRFRSSSRGRMRMVPSLLPSPEVRPACSHCPNGCRMPKTSRPGS